MKKQKDSYWQGYVEGEYVMLASPYAGQLQKLHVRRGEQTAVGKPVFALEQESERAARMEAEQRMKARKRASRTSAWPKRAPRDRGAARRTEAGAGRAPARGKKPRARGGAGEVGRHSRLRYDELRSAVDRDARACRRGRGATAPGAMPVGRDAERKAAEGDLEAAKASLAQAAWRLEQKSVAAPVAGLVHDTYFVEGEWVPAGRPVAALLPPGNVKVRFYVPEAALSSLALDKESQVRCDGCPAAVTAKVSYVSAQAEFTPPVIYSKESRTKLVFLVEARLEQASKLRPGPAGGCDAPIGK